MKIVSAVLVALMLFALIPISSLADISPASSDISVEGRNINDLSLSELTILAGIVSVRMHEVQMETGTVFSSGVYTAGKDFHAGFSCISVTSRSNKDLFTVCTIDGTAKGSVTHVVGMTDLAEESFLFLFNEGQKITILGDDVIIAPFK